MSIGSSAIGSFGVESDVDWYFIEGAPNTVVTLTSDGARMTVVAFSADGYTDRALIGLAEPFSIGTRGLFIAVKAQETGPYRLTLVSIGQDDRTDEFFDAPEVPSLATVEGTLDFPGDVDVVALRMAPRSSAELSLLAGRDGICDVADETGRVLHAFRQQVKVWSESGGVFFLSVRTSANTFVPSRWFLEVAAGGPDDAPDHPDFAHQVGVPAGQRFERSNDHDVFRLEPRPGRIYEATCSSTGLCPIEVLNGINQTLSRGTQVLRFKAPAVGPVFLSFSGTAETDWSWNLLELGTDDHEDELGTATMLARGAPMRGNIDFDGDVDAFTVSYPLGTLLRFNVAAPWWVQTNEGRVVSNQHVVNADPMLLFVVGAPGRYDIAVTSLTDPGGSDAMPVAVTLPFSADGGIDFVGDNDAWSFTPIRGHVYRVRVSPSQRIFVRQDPALSTSGEGSAQFVAAGSPVTVSVTNFFQVGGYQVQIEDIGVDDHPDETATPLLPGVPASGLFDSRNDLEPFSATLVPGRFYEARCTQPGCLVSRDPGSQSRPGSFCVQPTAAETPFTVTTPFVAGDFVSSSWSLELVDLGDDDHPSSVLQASPVPVDSSTMAMLSCHADADTFKWSAGPRQLTTLRASCTGCSVNVMSRWRLDASEVDGGLLLTVPPSSAPITATFETTQATALTFTVSDGGFDDHGDTLSTATAATVGGASTGELQYEGDADVFFFDLAAGGHLFDLTGPDVRGELWLATGPLFTLTTSSMQFNAPTAGRYFVLLKGRGTFQLVVQ